MVGAYGEVQGVTGPEAKSILVGKAGGCAELRARDRENGEAVGAQPREHRQRVGAVRLIQLTGAEFDGKRRGELCRHPVADDQIFRGLRREPGLHPFGVGFVGQGRDKERGVEIEAQ